MRIVGWMEGTSFEQNINHHDPGGHHWPLVVED